MTRDDGRVWRQRALRRAVLLLLVVGCTGASREASAAHHLLTTRDLGSDAASLHAKSDYSNGKSYGVLTSAELDPTGRGPSRAPDPNLAATRLGVARTWARSPNADGRSRAQRVNAIQSMYLEFRDSAAAKAAAASLQRFAAKDGHKVERSGSTTILVPTSRPSPSGAPTAWLGLHSNGSGLTVIEMFSTADDDLGDDVVRLVEAAIAHGG